MHARVGRHLLLGELVLHHQLVGDGRARAAIGLGHFGQQETQLAQAAPGLAGDEALAAPGIEVRRQLVRHATADLLAKAFDVGIHPGMLVQARQHAHHMPVRPPEQISVWPLT